MPKPKEYGIASVKPNVNYGLLVVIMCQSSFISCNKCTTGRNVDNGGGYACVGVGVFGNPSSEFSCESKTVLKNKLY